MARNAFIYNCKIPPLIPQHLRQLNPVKATFVIKTTTIKRYTIGIICYIIVMILSVSCTSSSISDNVRVINADITNKEIVNVSLSELDKTTLEVSAECMIGSIKDMVWTKYGYIIAARTGGVYRLMYFGLDGQYVCDIGHQGRGPNEFLNINSIFMFNDTLNVYSFFNQSILRYVIAQNEYTPLPPINIKDIKNGIIYMSATPEIPDRYIVKHILNGTPGHTTPLYGIYDRKWNLVDTSDVKYPAGGYSTLFPISIVDKCMYMAFIGSDTVFKTDGNHIIPSIIYNLGRSNLPADCKYNLVKRREFFDAHPNDSIHLFHNGTLVSKNKIYTYLSTANSPFIMVNDISDGESTFYRILNKNGEPAELLYMINTPEGEVYGIFMQHSVEDNPAIFNLSSL